jgi:diacylglycerol kinase (ATP)
MRAAAIFGLGSSEKHLKQFQTDSEAEWVIGLPGSSTDADAILLFGGDGTVHRHLAQLVKLQLPVLVVPRGSGNDFARALNLRSVGDSLAAWRKFSSGAGNVRTIDLGLIQALDSEDEAAGHGRYFCCVGGVGLDGEIARRANNLPRWLRGHGGYALSLLPVVLQFAALPMKILVPHAENADLLVERSAQPTVLATFANTPVYGGGMKIAPQAVIDDGLLDVCVVSDISKFKLFCLFPTVYFGRHLGMTEVQYFQAERLQLQTEMPLDVYADGEYVCRTPVEVRVAQQALRVIVP